MMLVAAEWSVPCHRVRVSEGHIESHPFVSNWYQPAQISLHGTDRKRKKRVQKTRGERHAKVVGEGLTAPLRPDSDATASRNPSAVDRPPHVQVVGFEGAPNRRPREHNVDIRELIADISIT